MLPESTWGTQGIPLLRWPESFGCRNAGETHGLLEQCPTTEAIDVQLPKSFGHMRGLKWTKQTSQKYNTIIIIYSSTQLISNQGRRRNCFISTFQLMTFHNHFPAKLQLFQPAFLEVPGIRVRVKSQPRGTLLSLKCTFSCHDTVDGRNPAPVNR